MNSTNGYIAVVKEDCPTCRLIVPVLAQVAVQTSLTVYSQDQLPFLEPVFTVNDTKAIHDSSLETSFRLNIETVPTLIKLEDSSETGRIIGWQREEWEQFTGIDGLGPDLPPWRPGCGAKNVEPNIKDKLAIQFGAVKMAARAVSVSDEEDEIEACFDRGWSDGFPLVPPTKLRVYRMLQGTTRDPAEIIGNTPHNHAPVSVEKVAINAVMAGCKPEYMPVVLTAVEAACDPKYGLRAFMASTWFSAPVVVVTGPITKEIGMESGFSAFGSGNRANATIGRALNLVVRNVGEVRPGEVARSTMGSPGRYSFCFAENEEETSWLSIAEERGVPKGKSAVTLLSGDGLQPIADERSRHPESLIISLATGLRAVYHHKWSLDADVILAVSPEHSRVFEQAGWSKARVREALEASLQMETDQLIKGVGGCEEGMVPEIAVQQTTVPKFLPGGIQLVRVGSNAGLYSAVISCWPSGGEHGTQPVTKIIEEA
ncbi:MAG: thioredoxin family protein [Chloroflexota bacterium]